MINVFTCKGRFEEKWIEKNEEKKKIKKKKIMERLEDLLRVKN